MILKILGKSFSRVISKKKLGKREQTYCIFLSAREPVHACEFVCVCLNGKLKSLGSWHSECEQLHVFGQCGAQVPPTAHKHSCCCLPSWQWSGRLQPAGPHAVLSADTLLQLVNMFCKGNLRENTVVKEPNISRLIFLCL